MKQLFFGAIVILTQTVSAHQPKPDENLKVIRYEVIKAGSKFSKAHLAKFDNGSVQLNYAQGTVSVFLSEKVHVQLVFLVRWKFAEFLQLYQS